MEPLLRAGMVIDVEPLTEPPRQGDILVFRGPAGLIAHRLVAVRRKASIDAGDAAGGRGASKGAVYITSGDAFPDRDEVVPARSVVGRLGAVWSGDGLDARRLDDATFYAKGRRMARFKRIRSWTTRVRSRSAVLLSRPASVAPPAAFGALVAATYAFERADFAEAMRLLRDIPSDAVVETARRHHLSGLMSRWIDEATTAGVSVPPELHEAFRRIRWTNALQAGRVLECIRDVRDHFSQAGIPYILLKGGARLASAEPDADLHYSGDLDILVPRDQGSFAVDVLRKAGYRDLAPQNRRAAYAQEHDREPVMAPHVNVPVEVHVSLAAPGLVSQALDYRVLSAESKRVTGPIGEVVILDRPAAAVHLAYHARDLRVWRDIVLLARILRGLDEAGRSRFDVFIRAETGDAVRLNTAVACAAMMAGLPATKNPAAVDYARWVIAREDLPLWLRTHAELYEAMVGKSPLPSIRRMPSWGGQHPWVRWASSVVALPAIVRTVRWRKGSLQTPFDV